MTIHPTYIINRCKWQQKVHDINNFMVKYFILSLYYIILLNFFIFTYFKFKIFYIVQVHQLEFMLQQKSLVPQSEVCFMTHKHFLSPQTSRWFKPKPIH